MSVSTSGVHQCRQHRLSARQMYELSTTPTVNASGVPTVSTTATVSTSSVPTESTTATVSASVVPTMSYNNSARQVSKSTQRLSARQVYQQCRQHRLSARHVYHSEWTATTSVRCTNTVDNTDCQRSQLSTVSGVLKSGVDNTDCQHVRCTNRVDNNYDCPTRRQQVVPSESQLYLTKSTTVTVSTSGVTPESTTPSHTTVDCRQQRSASGVPHRRVERQLYQHN